MWFYITITLSRNATEHYERYDIVINDHIKTSVITEPLRVRYTRQSKVLLP
jgi:hypothetical protein